MKLEAFIKALHAAGWRSTLDAQHAGVTRIWRNAYPAAAEYLDDLTAADGRIAELEAELAAARVDAWQPIESAPSDTVVMLYTPPLHDSNPERIEVRVYHDSRSGTRHAWATQWKPIDSLIDAARGVA